MRRVELAEQPGGVEDLAWLHAGGQVEGVEHNRGEAADLVVAGFEHGEVTAVSGKPLCRGAGCRVEACPVQVTESCPDRSVVQELIEDDGQDVVQQLESGNVGLRQGGLKLGQAAASSPVDTAECLVEQLNDLIGHLAVGRYQGGQQDRATRFGCHSPQRRWRCPATDTSELASPLWRHHRHINSVDPFRPQIGELGDFGLDRSGGGAGCPLVEPHDRRYPEVRVGGD